MSMQYGASIECSEYHRSTSESVTNKVGLQPMLLYRCTDITLKYFGIIMQGRVEN